MAESVSPLRHIPRLDQAEPCEACEQDKTEQPYEISPGAFITEVIEHVCAEPHEEGLGVCGLPEGHEGLHFAEIMTIQKLLWK